MAEERPRVYAAARKDQLAVQECLCYGIQASSGRTINGAPLSHKFYLAPSVRLLSCVPEDVVAHTVVVGWVLRSCWYDHMRIERDRSGTILDLTFRSLSARGRLGKTRTSLR